MRYSFSLNAEQQAKANEWLDEHHKTCLYMRKGGAIGGAITFSFTPTSLGDVQKITCSCKAELDLTDYESW